MPADILPFSSRKRKIGKERRSSNIDRILNLDLLVTSAIEDSASVMKINLPGLRPQIDPEVILSQVESYIHKIKDARITESEIEIQRLSIQASQREKWNLLYTLLQSTEADWIRKPCYYLALVVEIRERSKTA